MKSKDWIKLLLSFLAVAVVAAAGSFFTFKAIPTWYAQLNTTVITPPNWVFGPAWTILYLMMAVAAFLVWRQGIENKKVREGLWLFLAQLILNFLWSFIFFGQQQMFLAFIEIIILWSAILLTIIWFYKTSKTAAWLLVPYLAWVSFAAVLNLLTWLANR